MKDKLQTLLRKRIKERTEACQADWTNEAKDRVRIMNEEDRELILALESLELKEIYGNVKHSGYAPKPHKIITGCFEDKDLKAGDIVKLILVK